MRWCCPPRGRLSRWNSARTLSPVRGEIRVKVSACGVCRTDLHVVDAEFPASNIPIIPGHEIVGRVDLVGGSVTTHRVGDRVGIPWLGYTCGVCRFCKEGMENLCDHPLFTGYTRDGGFATPHHCRCALRFPARRRRRRRFDRAAVMRGPDRLAIAGDGG